MVLLVYLHLSFYLFGFPKVFDFVFKFFVLFFVSIWQYESNASRKEKRDKEEAEEEKKPGRLELLLAQSKFTCNGKKDGYYADASVACQVFHYCVGGAKHSWQCPEGTVFHQVHLNCVPASQDICSQSEKFFVVNEYLHKVSLTSS